MLKILAESTEMTINAIDVLTKVDQFYHNAWVKLVIVISIAGFTVGIVVPAIIHWLQSRSFDRTEREFKNALKAAEDGFEKKIQKADERLITMLEKKYDKLLAEKLDDIEKVVEGKLKTQEETLLGLTDTVRSEVFGYLEHLKGGVHLDIHKHYGVALETYCNAAMHYLQYEGRQDNLQSVLKVIVENCLPNLDKNQLQADTELAKSINELIEELKKKNQDERYTNYIWDIEFQLKLAKKRESSKSK